MPEARAFCWFRLQKELGSSLRNPSTAVLEYLLSSGSMANPRRAAVEERTEERKKLEEGLEAQKLVRRSGRSTPPASAAGRAHRGDPLAASLFAAATGLSSTRHTADRLRRSPTRGWPLGGFPAGELRR